MELPDIVALDRSFRGPRFETVTVSVDEAERREAVLSALRRVRADVTNYQFTGTIPALVERLDPTWSGALPFTLLLAPGGEVLFRCEGTLELTRLRLTIARWLRPESPQRPPDTPRARARRSRDAGPTTR